MTGGPTAAHREWMKRDKFDAMLKRARSNLLYGGASLEVAARSFDGADAAELSESVEDVQAAVAKLDAILQRMRIESIAKQAGADEVLPLPLEVNEEDGP